MAPLTTPPDLATPRGALLRGQAAMAAGQMPVALAWFDRAARLAPNDPTVRLLQASALIDQDPAGCRSVLQVLLAGNPAFRDARVLLIACEVRAGCLAAARDILATLLAEQAPPGDVRFARLASTVTQAAGAPGWVGAGSGGVAHIGLIGPGSAASLVLELDGKAIMPGRGPSGRLAAQATRLRFRLPRAWQAASALTARLNDIALIGSPLDLARRRMTEGAVSLGADGALEGWAWHPADPDLAAAVTVVLRNTMQLSGEASKARPSTRRVTAGALLESAAENAVAQPRIFRVPAADLPLQGEVRVIGADGRDLAGSPLIIGWEEAANRQATAMLAHAYAVSGSAPAVPGDAGPDPWRPMAVAPWGDTASPVDAPRRRPIDIVIPVFRGAADFTACLATLRGQVPRGGRIIVVDDAAPDVALRDAVDAAAARGEIVLLRHTANRGFPAAVNTGLRHALAKGARDVLLLNPDTLLPAGAVRRLARAAYAAGDIGSVTPMSNDGTIISYPRPGTAAGMPDLAALHRLDAAFAAANAGQSVDLPTGVGFCLYLRHDCLAAVGGLREDVFAQGYGEENDFCLRARHLGWRHVAAGDVFVAHAGGRSFGAVKSHLIARNLHLLNRLHPGYDAFVAAFAARDPLAALRRAVDMHLWREGRCPGGAVVLISHAKAGGVARHVAARAASLRAAGLRAILLEPVQLGPDGSCRLADPSAPDAAAPAFTLPAEFDALLDALRDQGVRWVELHHLLGHLPEMADLAGRLAVPLDVFVHDYAAWCPRVTLVSRTGRYCGEPARIEECADCVRDLGGRLGEEIGPAALRTRSAAWLRSARRVIVSCEDVADRVHRHFPFLDPLVRPWEDDTPSEGIAPAAPPLPRLRRTRIVVAGGIGGDKGYDILLACARDAARRDLALEFVLVGHSLDDGRLLETDRVFVTGRFDEAEGAALVAAQQGDLGFIPSVWPETWCYALSLLWQGGLDAVSFDIGAQAERIRRRGTGAVLPLGLPTSRLNTILLEVANASRRRSGAPDGALSAIPPDGKRP